MITQWRRSALALFVGYFCTAQTVAAAANLEGRLKQTAAPATKLTASTVQLLGGVNDDAQLRSSIKVLPGQASGTQLYPYAAQTLEQFSGNARQSGRMPALSTRTPTFAPIRSGSVPAITTYHATPRNGIMTFGDEYTSTPVIENKHTTTWAPSSVPSGSRGSTLPAALTEYKPTASKGVTCYTAESEISQGSSLGEPVVALVSRKGIGCYVPEANTVPVETVEPTTATGSGGKLTAWNPGGALTTTISKKGITCWSPGYQVAVAFPPDIIGQTVGGVWSLPGAKVNNDTAARLSSKDGYGKLLSPVQPMLATALLSPKLQHSQFNENLSWTEWYNCVGRAVYGHWSQADVGPGSARVRIAVDSNRKVTGELIEFLPKADRNVDNETNFRQAAVRSVNLVNSWEIPKLPEGRSNVVFDLEMTRTTDGVPGVN